MCDKPIDVFHNSFFSGLSDGELSLGRLTNSPRDLSFYYALSTNAALNRYWGYDYRKETSSPTPAWFYDSVLKDFSSKKELSLLIRVSNEPIGEVVLHSFTAASAEIGVRLLETYQKKGFAKRALTLLIHRFFSVFPKAKLTAKCYLLNTASYFLLLSCGFSIIKKDDTFFYFSLSI